MSRQLHLVETTPDQLQAQYRRAHLVALALFAGFFTLFVMMAPEVAPIDAPAPAMAAVSVSAELP